jgi:hypothetical protein
VARVELHGVLLLVDDDVSRGPPPPEPRNRNNSAAATTSAVRMPRAMASVVRKARLGAQRLLCCGAGGVSVAVMVDPLCRVEKTSIRDWLRKVK